jgi:hypothetical protein
MFHTVDWGPTELKTILIKLVVFRNKSDVPPIFEGISVCGMIGVFCGINTKKEFAIALNSKSSSVDTMFTILFNLISGAELCLILLRDSLEKSINSDEALNSLKYNHISKSAYFCYFNNTNKIDNGLNEISNSNSRLIARRPGYGLDSLVFEETMIHNYLIQTNLDYPFTCSDRFRTDLYSHSIERYKVAAKLCNKLFIRLSNNKNFKISNTTLCKYFFSFPILTYYTMCGTVMSFTHRKKSNITSIVPTNDQLNKQCIPNDTEFNNNTEL